MADDTPPPELVQARRDFMAADAELAALAAGAPSAIAQDGRVVGVDPELAARMAAVHARARIARFRVHISKQPLDRPSVRRLILATSSVFGC